MLIALGTKNNPAELDKHLAETTCEGCHKGDPAEQDDPAKAHVDLVKDPSTQGACTQCHGDIEKNQTQSMHATLQGEKAILAKRFGHESYDKCPEKLKTAYEGECMKCHATCGDCHVSRPDSAGKGFIKNHVFQKKPSQKYQCMGCHGARVGEDFVGNEDAGRKPDAHFAMGMSCTSCHDGAEMHAPAGAAKHRYEAPGLPKCTDCHSKVSAANSFHLMHWDGMSCYVCHSQPYSNCTGCHVAGVYKDDPVYKAQNPFQAFKIGRNPLPGKTEKWALVRHAPVAPDTFDAWKTGETPVNFDAEPTWKFTSPHSIQRWTTQTQTVPGVKCGASCHVGAPGGSAANKSLYLLRAEVKAGWPTEANANESVVADDALPAGWLTP